MLPASLYMPLYHQTMLLVILGCALVYWQGRCSHKSLTQFNQVFLIVTGLAVVMFIGFRPVSGIYFIDMGDYARSYESVQQGNKGSLPDMLFNGLMQLCAPVLPTAGFFFVCTVIYVAPLAVASWRIHGTWAFPVFLAYLTAFSFWGYGVNGIRNGIAMSVLILAFAYHDRPLVMLALIASAWGFHAASLLPAAAFLIVRYLKWTRIWMAFWVVCVGLSLFAGNVGQMLLSRYNPFAGDNRVEGYILGSEGGGFRADFLLYSIFPVLVTLLLAAPAHAPLRRIAARMVSSPSVNGMRNRKAVDGNRSGVGMLARPKQGGAGRVCSAGVSPAGSAGVSLADCSGRETPPEPPAGTAALHRVSVRIPSTDLAGARATSHGQERSQPRTRLKQSGWNSLPWVRFLRSDHFYARLLNTYLLTNALWVLAINANSSNRFAYLSWFMLPWVLMYPFLPGKEIKRPRIDLITATLLAHYSFTYLMMVVIYPLRGIVV